MSLFGKKTKENPDGKYLPPWWAANLDLRRSLDYMNHWKSGSRKLLGQHDTGIDPSLGFDAHGAFVSRLDKDFKHGRGTRTTR